MSYLLALDIGTTNIKALAFSADLVLVDMEKLQLLPISEKHGWQEQDPEAIVQACSRVIRVLVSRCGAPLGICISSAMHAIVGIDHEEQAIGNFLLWSDTRSSQQANQLRESESTKQFYEQSGTPIHPMSPFVKLLWFKQEAPKLFSRAEKWVGIKSYLLFHWTGEWFCDYSMASGMGLFDVTQKSWSREALDLLGLSYHHFPQLVDTDVQLPKLDSSMAAEWDMPVGTPVIIGGADGPLANLGAGIDDYSIPVLTIGTSGAIRRRCTHFQTIEKQQLFCYYLDQESYVLGGASNNGGNVFQWLQTIFGQLDYQKILSETPSDPDLLFLPFLQGERAPIWNAAASAQLVGLNGQHSKEQIIKAMLEGVMLNMATIAQQLEQATSPIERIYVSGGFTQLPAWVQLLADVLGKTLLVGENTEASGRGAAMIGWKALGFDSSKKGEVFQEIQPSIQKRAFYTTLLDRFKNLVNI